nr:MAG: E6 protein [Varecia rubra papillomavirus 1]
MEQPLTVEALAQSLGVPVTNILLHCTFCGKRCTVEDLFDFQLKELQLVWKEYGPLGACRPCIREVALKEVREYGEVFLEADGVERLTGKDLRELLMRCMCCLKKLSYLEKLHFSTRDGVFILVRGMWKGRCMLCG